MPSGAPCRSGIQEVKEEESTELAGAVMTRSWLVTMEEEGTF